MVPMLQLLAFPSPLRLALLLVLPPSLPLSLLPLSFPPPFCLFPSLLSPLVRPPIPHPHPSTMGEHHGRY